jgi:hypothetical protein
VTPPPIVQPPPAQADPRPAVVEPRPPGTAVLVVINGDDAGARSVESAILRSLVGRGGLQALDPNSLSIIRGDQSAVQAAAQGNFSALAGLGREHGVEVMVVGDLRSRAMPSINRFFTGTAEVTLRMYRVSTGQLVSAETLTSPPQLAISEAEARSKAAAVVGDAAAERVGRGL